MPRSFSKHNNLQIGSNGFVPTTRRGTRFRSDDVALEVSLADLKQYRTYLNSLAEEGDNMMYQVAEVWRDQINDHYQSVWRDLRGKLQQFEQDLDPVCTYLDRKIQEHKRSE